MIMVVSLDLLFSIQGAGDAQGLFPFPVFDALSGTGSVKAA